MQKTCTQLYRGRLWKCPALAYFAQMEKKSGIEAASAWRPFRDYQACPPTASDVELEQFFAARAIPQCGLCPSKRVPFRHPNPLEASSHGHAG